MHRWVVQDLERGGGNMHIVYRDVWVMFIDHWMFRHHVFWQYVIILVTGQHHSLNHVLNYSWCYWFSSVLCFWHFSLRMSTFTWYYFWPTEMGETQPGTRLLLALPSFCQLKNLLDKRKRKKEKEMTTFHNICWHYESFSLSYTGILGSLSYTGMLGLTGT